MISAFMYLESFRRRMSWPHKPISISSICEIFSPKVSVVEMVCMCWDFATRASKPLISWSICNRDYTDFYRFQATEKLSVKIYVASHCKASGLCLMIFFARFSWQRFEPNRFNTSRYCKHLSPWHLTLAYDRGTRTLSCLWIQPKMEQYLKSQARPYGPSFVGGTARIQAMVPISAFALNGRRKYGPHYEID